LSGFVDRVFKNDKLLFSYNSEFIENNRIRNILEINDKLVFETYRKK
jgi:hypothetical protein